MIEIISTNIHSKTVVSLVCKETSGCKGVSYGESIPVKSAKYKRIKQKTN